MDPHEASASRGRPHHHEGSCAQPPPAATSSLARPRKRDRRRLRVRRQHQRRPAPHRDCKRDGHRAHHGRLRPHQRPHALHLGSLPRRQIRREGLPGRGRLARPRQAPARRRPAQRRHLTVTGKTIDEEAPVAVETPGQPVIRPTRAPDQGRPAASSSCSGNLAPEGCGRQGRRPRAHFTAAPPASSMARMPASPPSRPAKINPDDVLVIRYEGPRGGPGMREMLPSPQRSRHPRALATPSPSSPTAASPARLAGLWSATSHPKPSVGGPIAAVREGDTITFDIPNRKLTLEVPEAEIAALAHGRPPSRASNTVSSPSTQDP